MRGVKVEEPTCFTALAKVLVKSTWSVELIWGGERQKLIKILVAKALYCNCDLHQSDNPEFIVQHV